jgi:hypothetical protein
MSEIALKRIREAKETRAYRLDLWNCELTELPQELAELTWLRSGNGKYRAVLRFKHQVLYLKKVVIASAAQQ